MAEVLPPARRSWRIVANVALLLAAMGILLSAYLFSRVESRFEANCRAINQDRMVLRQTLRHHPNLYHEHLARLVPARNC